MNHWIEIIIGLPKSIVFNFSQLDFRHAIRLPILVSHRTKFKSIKGNICIEGECKPGMVRIGLSGSGSGTAYYKPVVIENNGTIVFQGKVSIGGGCQLCTVRKESKLVVGGNSKLMGECHLVAASSVSIGKDCAISWNTQIMDTDFHHIYGNDGQLLNAEKPVLIGNHVWIGSHSIILKGTALPDELVVAAGSIINAGHLDISEGSVITGLPTRVLRDNIRWEM